MEQKLIFHIQRTADLDPLAAKFARTAGLTLLEQTDTLLHYVLDQDGRHLIYRTTLPPQIGTLFGKPGEAGESLFHWLTMLTGYVVADLAEGRAAMRLADLHVLQEGDGWCLLIDPDKPVFGIVLLTAPPEWTL